MSNLLAIPVDTDGEGAADDVVYTVGGDERLRVTYPAESGGFILAEVEITRDLFNSFAESTQQGMVLDARHFSLKGGHTDGAALFVEEIAGPLYVDLKQAPPMTSGWAVLPPGIVADREEEIGSASTRVEYEREGAIGDVTFRPRGQTGSPLEVFASGLLTVQTPEGMAVIYRYDGQQMSMHWPRVSTGRLVRTQYIEPRGAGKTGSRKLTLLIPRPRRKGSSNLTLWMGDLNVATLDGALAKP